MKKSAVNRAARTAYGGFNTLALARVCVFDVRAASLASFRIKAFMYITALRVGTQPFPFQMTSYKLSVSKHTLELKLIAKLINSSFFLSLSPSLLVAPTWMRQWMQWNSVRANCFSHTHAHSGRGWQWTMQQNGKCVIIVAQLSHRMEETNEYIHHPSPANSNKSPFTRWKITVCQTDVDVYIVSPLNDPTADTQRRREPTPNEIGSAARLIIISEGNILGIPSLTIGNIVVEYDTPLPPPDEILLIDRYFCRFGLVSVFKWFLVSFSQ